MSSINSTGGQKQGGGSNQGGGMTNIDKELLGHLNNMDEEDKKHKKEIEAITGAIGKLRGGGGSSSGKKK